MDQAQTLQFVRDMPKVELHVHVEGSIRPETVLDLARRNAVDLPADTVEGLRDWYSFRDFKHFVEVYVAVSRCVQTPEDIETVFREFLAGQARQNVRHTEATYTACTIEKYAGIPWDEQRDAIANAVAWGRRELGTSLGVILDIVRGDPPERAAQVLEWVEDGKSSGVVALGLAGMEWLGTKQYAEVFQEARRKGVPLIAHAGETTGPEAVWDVLEAGALRVGHGVRCYEDPRLVEHLRERAVHLEVSPTSNVCLGVFPDYASHPLRRMVDDGLNVSVNSDDPPMFSTSVTSEWETAVREFGFDAAMAASVTMNAVEAALLTEPEKAALRSTVDQAAGLCQV
ncbi:MAG: adenosine deaminase [Armatimonadetes bacterium]|nr:adenosine deaminase [Armatimonadota bacterium]